MVSNGPMNDYIGEAVKRYSSLFTLPSHLKMLLFLFALCMFDGALILSAQQPVSLYNVVLGLGLGMAMFASVTVADLSIHLFNLRHDPIFDLRRCSALSLYSIAVWSIFIVLGVIVNAFFDVFWFKLFLVGFSAALALRLLVFSAVSFARTEAIAISAVSLPVFFAAPVVVAAFVRYPHALDISIAIFFSLSLAVIVGSIFTFITSINKVGTETLGLNSLSILKAFLANWTENLTAPLEHYFERFGLKRDIRVAALAFKAKGKVKAMMVVPTFHPGPFRNIGSSSLPYTIQRALESRLEHCIVTVPHGLSGHELDLVSQAQNQLVVDASLRLTNLDGFSPFATPFVRIKRNSASACCQMFGRCAFVALTLAPETMEDLPPELDTFIANEAEKKRVLATITVDAHNSIQGPFKIDEMIDSLRDAAVTSVREASKHKMMNFQVGVAKVTPEEFGLKNGMGPGGIIVLLVGIKDQLVAYITIDGNNMVSGLREEILSMLRGLGVDDGEVFTTDTHAVNAIGMSSRGYHPIGEAIDHDRLMGYIKRATVAAIDDLEPAEVSWRKETASGVQVIGEKQIEDMCMLIVKVAIRAKRLALSVFSVAGAILTVLLLLL